MSFGGGGSYGINQNGQPIGLNPQTASLLYAQPLLRLLLGQAAQASPGIFNNPQGNPLYGQIQNFAQSATANARPIAPTIPGLQLPQQIRDILSGSKGQGQAQVAQELAQAAPGGFTSNPTNPNSLSAPAATSTAAMPSTPTSAQPAQSSSAPAAPATSINSGGDRSTVTLQQIIQQAIADSMNQGGNTTGGPAGTTGGGGNQVGGQGPSGFEILR